MTLRTVLIVVLAVVFGVAAAVYATNAVNRNRDTSSPEKVGVLITTRAVPRGSTLTAEMLDMKAVFKDDAPADSLHAVEEGAGRVAEKDLVKGDYVLESKLARKGANAGMAPLIPEGMQAATILTPTAASGVGGFIRPGDRVDVFLSVDHFNPNDRGGTVRLLQNVQVLAADNRMEAAPTTVEGKVVEQPRDLRFVTLLVTPKEAQILADGGRRGTLSLILRNPQDSKQLAHEVVTPEDLKFPPDKPEAVTKGSPAPALRVIRGSVESPANTP
jgi:pilus assembly protein CpaB